jgi:hypothetical protein
VFVKVESNKNSLGKEQYLNEGEYKFIFLLGTTYGVLSMEDDETFLAIFVDRKSMPLKIFLSLNFSNKELWHIKQINTSLCEGPIYLLLCKFFIFLCLHPLL